MIQIIISGERLDLPPGFAFEIEDSNPVFNDRGPQSMPVTVPATPRNSRLLGWPQRLDTGRHPAAPEIRAAVVCGPHARLGTVNVTEASPDEGITLSVGFDNSTAYSRWAARRLKDLDSLPEVEFDSTDTAFRAMATALHNPDTECDYAVFPIAVTHEDKDSQQRWEILNRTVASDDPASLGRFATVRRWIDGEDTEVKVPDCYGITPFLRVWRVLELVFADLGLRLLSNPMRDDPDLARLVVLNNSADALVTARLRYAELMPDCTVQEFIDSLWCRFGLVYSIDDTAGTARLRLLRDILRDPAPDITPWTRAREKVTWETPRYVRLSAQKGIEGAGPACATFEEFSKGLDLSRVSMGYDVDDWALDPDAQGSPRWDGDSSYWSDLHDPDDPDYPDPPDPDYPDEPDYPDDYDDGRDDERAATRSDGDAVAAATVPVMLARECVTGNWYRLDEFNGRTRVTSSPFFDWDPQPEGMEAEELTAADECVPVGTAEYFDYRVRCPLYLFGARHFHSYIDGAGDDDESGDTTPLAFMFALEMDRGCVGRHTPETDNGTPYRYADGTRPRTTLLFQFADGLFANFWKDYDEILRHGNRSVEVPVRIPPTRLAALDMTAPVALGGIRCLPDTLTYTAAGGAVNADLKVRTIQTAGDYDIGAERKIPAFAAVFRHVEWRVKWSTRDNVCRYAATLDLALRSFAATGYTPPSPDAEYEYAVNRSSPVLLSTSVAAGDNPADDTSLPPVREAGQRFEKDYPVSYTYAVYLVRSARYAQPPIWRRTGSPLGEVTVDSSYRVQFVARWVTDDSPLGDSGE